VQDTGVGISETDKAKLFQPFSQLNEANLSEIGTGLGLAICKQYLELMGGYIDVQSTLGKGALFYFELPVDLCSMNLNVENPIHARVIGLAQGQIPPRILIAEDQADNRLLIHRLLEPLGFELRDAFNGQEAITLFEQWQPQLIFMDIRMPVLNGLEATKRIKALDKSVKIVALTAHALEEERLQILAAGCDDFIRKPFQNGEVFHALEALLGVRFRYSDRQENSNLHMQAHGLEKGMLVKIPKFLVIALREAVILLDERTCLSIIGQIRIVDELLANTLSCMIKNLQYKELIAILDSVYSHD
jgi:Amt family ammonium transporter